MQTTQALQTFQYEETPVRTILKDGAPWWVLADVCKVLGLTTPAKVANRLDDDERGMNQIHTPSGVQQMTIISESGLYKVILRSDKPEAKAFTRWVTHEVLPAIRRTGGYIAGGDGMSPEELMAKALEVARQTLAAREIRIAALTVENQIMQPKAEYFDALVERGTLTNFRETARQLQVKERAFVNFLIERKYIYRDKRGKLLPYADKNNGLFEVKECYNEKTKWSGTQTLVTPKGRETFRLLCQGL